MDVLHKGKSDKIKTQDDGTGSQLVELLKEFKDLKTGPMIQIGNLRVIEELQGYQMRSQNG